MTNLYSDELINAIKQRKKRSIAFIIIVMLAATSVNLILLFLSNEDNAIMMRIITSVIFVSAGWFSIWSLYSGVLTGRKRISIIDGLLNGKIVQIRCTVTKIIGPMTLSDSTKNYELTVLVNQKQMKLFLDEAFDTEIVRESEEMLFNVSDNRIIAYEVIENE